VVFSHTSVSVLPEVQSPLGLVAWLLLVAQERVELLWVHFPVSLPHPLWEEVGNLEGSFQITG